MSHGCDRRASTGVPINNISIARDECSPRFAKMYFNLLHDSQQEPVNPRSYCES